MSSGQVRKRPGLNLERSYEVWRWQEQLVTGAYELLVPIVRRPVPARPSAAGRRPRAAAQNLQRQAVGG